MDIALSGVTDIGSSWPGDFPLITKMCDEFSINRPCNTGDVFGLALDDLNILDEQRQLLYSLQGGVLKRENGLLASSRLSVKLQHILQNKLRCGAA